MSVMGATSGGNLTNLIALGAMDTHLTQCPSITYWRFRYNRYTNFTMESMEQTFESPVAFGADVKVTLNRNGDLVYFCYAVITLPGICACNGDAGATGCNMGGFGTRFPACDPCDPVKDLVMPDPCGGAGFGGAGAWDGLPSTPLTPVNGVDPCTGLETPYAHYINAVGQFLIKRASIVIGGHVIETLYNDFLFMWEELSGKPGKRLTEMIGKRFTRAQLVEDSRFQRTLYVPLPFWFTQCSGNALPICSLQFHGIQILISFEQLAKVIQVSAATVTVVKNADRMAITNQDLQARIDTTYVYLDMEERDLFATGCFEQLITQTQALYQPSKGKQIRMNLNFNHPVIELIFAVRRHLHEKVNNWFNYAGKWGLDPVTQVDLLLNNSPRFGSREGRYFRMVQPYQHHTNIPDSFIYNYSFALHPEEPQPSGSCNFSRIDSVQLILTLQEQLAIEDVSNTQCTQHNDARQKQRMGVKREIDCLIRMLIFVLLCLTCLFPGDGYLLRALVQWSVK